MVGIGIQAQSRPFSFDADAAHDCIPHLGNRDHRTVKSFREIDRKIRLVAPTNMSVLILGESGTGKEHIAEKIHTMSKRSAGPFVAVDCGLLSKELAASSLFGHEKGAFTGAESKKQGFWEEAAGGTSSR